METPYEPLDHIPTGRVSSHSAESVNKEIGQDIIDRVVHLAANPSAIAARLEELDKEWDVERTLETNASSLILAGLALSFTVDRRWLILSGGVAAFLLQHGIQGWCPPLVALRKLGFRTREEIDWERIALKAVRGDFAALSDIRSPRDRARAALTFAGD